MGDGIVDYTSLVYRELCSVKTQHASVRKAELVTILRLAGSMSRIAGRLAPVYEVDLRNEHTVVRVRQALSQVYGVASEGFKSPGNKENPRFSVRIARGAEITRLTGIWDVKRGRNILGFPNSIMTGSLEEMRGMLRGAFLARGSLIRKGNSLSLEFECGNHLLATGIMGAISRFNVKSVMRETRGAVRVHIREGEDVVKLLQEIGAHMHANKLNQAKLERARRGAANRLVNFDDANLQRSTAASAVARKRIKRAFEILDGQVSAKLREAGELRLQYVEASLEELGAKADPPLTKDTVAGRIRRLLQTADKVAEKKGIPDTNADIDSGRNTGADISGSPKN
ncbi:DNA-binding protein WhiA [Canibacter sp. lx-72]|uniref:DNA-binding protein WhiA n=1 Tax=Canibacter zhuwentaonis TaxID=2837491 RepID=UPI001BDD5644|nr:DNA-binding protein WhiA [Canibacter zhuwentaonis]